MATFCQIPVIEPKNTLATKAPAVAPRRTAPLSSVCRALFTGLFLSFYAVCSNQSDMDFLLHQRDLPGVAKRLTLADILRHEIDLRPARTCNGSQAGQRRGDCKLAGCSGGSRATLRKAQRAHLPQRSQQARAARETPASRKCWPCRPFRPGGFHDIAHPRTPCRRAALPSCRLPAPRLSQPCRDMPVPRSSYPSSIDAPSVPPLRSGTCRALCRALCRTLCGILCGALRPIPGNAGCNELASLPDLSARIDHVVSPGRIARRRPRACRSDVRTGCRPPKRASEHEIVSGPRRLNFLASTVRTTDHARKCT